MAQEFSKDNAPHSGDLTLWRARKVVHAAGPFTEADDVKVNGRKVKEPSFVVVHDALENKAGKIELVSADKFREEFAPAKLSDAETAPPMMPQFDVHEASKEQASGMQMDESVKGDDDAARVIAETP